MDNNKKKELYMKIKKYAFTLAEVLVTLGVIGVVAAITMPALINNYQRIVLKNQFKKAYSLLSNAVFQTQSNLGYGVGCSYWDESENSGCPSTICTAKDPIYNTCKSWKCSDGNALPSNYNGPRFHCSIFEQELFNKTLKPIKFCNNNGLANGCIPKDYRGTDKVKTEQNPNSTYPYNPSADFSDSNIKNKYSSWVLSNGMIIIKYGTYTSESFPVYTIDVNGAKKPNKWGHDIFTFSLKGNTLSGITKVAPACYANEKGGKCAVDMLKE